LNPYYFLIMRLIFFGLVILLFTGCDLSKKKSLDCPGVNCLSSNANFALRFVDKNTGEDLVENGTIEKSHIKIMNGGSYPLLVTNKLDVDTLENAIVFMDYSRNGKNTIRIFNTTQTISFDYDYSIRYENCCNIGDIKSISLSNYSYEMYPLGNLGPNFKVIVIKL